MITIKQIQDNSLKSQITEKVLRALPEWFGIEESTVEYIENVKNKIFFAAYDKNSYIGFLCLEFHNDYTADIYVTGILKEYHRMGIGLRLISTAERYLQENNYKFLMVKTLGESSDYEYYKRTREFYKAAGFYPLEEFEQIWGKNNPCLIMIKVIN